MADQRPPGRRHFQGATAAGRSLARRKRSRTFVRTSARVLSAVTKTESRRRVVARNGAHLRVARGVRLDYEPRRSPINRRVCLSKRRRRVRVRSAEDGSHVSALFESGRRFQRQGSAVRFTSDQLDKRLADEGRRDSRRLAIVQEPHGNKLMIHKLKPENEKGVCK